MWKIECMSLITGSFPDGSLVFPRNGTLACVFPMGPGPKVVHYKGNREPFGGQTVILRSCLVTAGLTSCPPGTSRVDTSSPLTTTPLYNRGDTDWLCSNALVDSDKEKWPTWNSWACIGTLAGISRICENPMIQGWNSYFQWGSISGMNFCQKTKKILSSSICCYLTPHGCQFL